MEDRKQRETGEQWPGITFNDPPPVICFLKLCPTCIKSQNCITSREQIVQNMRLWGSFYIQTITHPYNFKAVLFHSTTTLSYCWRLRSLALWKMIKDNNLLYWIFNDKICRRKKIITNQMKLIWYWDKLFFWEVLSSSCYFLSDNIKF
jgi:hypothetical protein